MDYIAVIDDMTVKKVKTVTEEEIPEAFDSGFFTAFFRFNEGNELEYANVDFDSGIVTWKKPEFLLQS